MEISIRPAGVSDARGINELRRMPGVFENILGIPSERVSRNEKFLQEMGPDQHQFVAVVQNEAGTEIVIGTIGLTVKSNPRMRHSADIGLMVHKDYQNKGVGSQLMAAVVDLADNWLMLIRLELTAFVDNERAIGLYRKFGFVDEGIRKMAAIRNGCYVDEIAMSRIRQ